MLLVLPLVPLSAILSALSQLAVAEESGGLTG